ncbi:class I SAM-dependent methyltransferase [Soonwooa sp.]|uniref:class I SAM-dependent methyltransferase n=1 Tax=Soonwooa sp. TaxID=1938592 RepID=UPI00260E59BB|nr:class I SAM-dependent methyltransferase [Soonwooa sp.]
MENNQPDNTALRTALWRALHVQIDDKPSVIEDEIGFHLIKPEEGWQERPDMKFTKSLRASIVARARFIEDLTKEQIAKGVKQYVLLGAGLDSFAQRNAEIGEHVQIFEIDQPSTLAWKQERLLENNYEISENLHFVPVDFETSSWLHELTKNGFDIKQQAVVSCTGVSLYLSQEAIIDTLKKLSSFASDSTIAISFYLPIEELEGEDKHLMEISIKGAAASGTPFVSFFSFDEITKLAEKIGFKDIRIISTNDMTDLYFKNRADKLVPSNGEFFLVAKTQ